MARHSSLLASPSPSNIVPTNVTIGHVQLRDLIICPRERGIVNYVQGLSIVEHDLNVPGSAPRSIADLSFNPNTITSLQISGKDATLLAAGGQDAEIHLSLHASSSPSQSRHRQRSRNLLWNYYRQLPGSINNSVLLTSLSLSRSHESSVEPRLVVSNNDCSVKFYDIPMSGQTSPKDIYQVGQLLLDVPVNHSSISPDGRTLLSVGDSPQIYLHQLNGGSRIKFTPIMSLSVPPPDVNLHSSSALAASFSTAFSGDGMKFAVASQEGVVAVWDVRSSKPLKVLQTDKSRLSSGLLGNGSAGGWLSDDPSDWTRGGSRAPGWGVRSVKFGSGGLNGQRGRELMTFTEHTCFLHVVDALTFETEEVIHVPGIPGRRNTLHSPAVQPPIVIQPPPTSPPRQASDWTRAVVSLEEAFRVSTAGSPSRVSSSRWRAAQHSMRRNDDDSDSVVIIPPLGDVVAENDVRSLLTRHGVRSRHPNGFAVRPPPPLSGGHSGGGDHEIYGDYHTDYDDNRDREAGDLEMEVDELESDCLSSHTPSRSSSPSPSVHLPMQTSPIPVSSPSRIAPTPHHHRHHGRSRRRTITRDDFVERQDYDLDLAGTCFDPSGGYIYVAGVDSISEWAVRGADKRWWCESAWM
ncbi:hypothetical protein SERLA73DRAFT_181173 [Serpula lacrymans var. lacrymans S7.3]|uniref:Uncharacterized protein n=2 Tax=Serpula lacrymans var. lacrymans TaxID=341189 RepID=F8PXK8_SERL3|nr:uncharacterized protein SERLADRAFT_467097 [Serpula lacrymans var. lacrymans S7.9]EGN98621.1 hypothetical protein SERLA73DRAFT_181173 [Serpula lacrymans var. lacrymans S7.3]EGO24188.1 hypothetical protein SERLADRAFT_467097 [Serpula lacrymans var. lacrymans S7.9]